MLDILAVRKAPLSVQKSDSFLGFCILQAPIAAWIERKARTMEVLEKVCG